MRYVIDPQHSDLEFKIRHLMISSVRGRFTKFEASMDSASDNFSDAKIECTIYVDSIDTSITERDAHLKSPDFFNVEKYPNMFFKSESLKEVGKNTYEVQGSLTIKNISRPITLIATYNGSDVDHYGQEKFGFEMNGTINREDWGLDFNVTGGRSTLLIGDEVKLNLEVQMMRA